MKDNVTWSAVAAKWLLVASSIIFFYTSGFGSFSTLTQRALHWAFMATAAYLLLQPRTVWGKVVKLVLAAAAVAAGAYVIIIWRQRIFGVGAVSSIDQVMGIIAIITLLIAVKLTVGWGLTITATFFLVYALFGPIFPGFMGHSGVRIPRLINFLYLTAEGIFGVALGISSTYIIAFVIFGAVLKAYGGGEWFVDVSYALAGRFRGGPAKTAVIASALMGTVSGAPVANVATTGTFTIPLMKRVGYPAATAGAIEAVASTGGMFLPPVMGAGAFIMAEYLNVQYIVIIKAALIPALLYYLALFLITDVRAAKSNLKGLPPESLPSVRDALFKRGYHGLPLLFLIVTIVIGWSPLRAAFWSSVLAMGLAFIVMRNPKEWFKRLIQALYDGSKQTVPIAMACAGAGIIVGVLGVTGLGTKIASGLLSLSGGNLLLGLFFTMVSAIILGAGMPVTAVYIILAATLVQPLIAMGVMPIAAHMFIFMFSAVAGLTPPVAITSYTAAGIAEAEPNAVAIQGFLYGLPGFIIPFLFAVAPALLMQGPVNQVILAIITATVGIICLVAAIEGFFIVSWPPVLRVLLFCAALLSLRPGYVTDLVAVGIIAVSIIARVVLRRRLASKPSFGG
jgi:TRAP transporter 4TM/12TM fusion protein